MLIKSSIPVLYTHSCYQKQPFRKGIYTWPYTIRENVKCFNGPFVYSRTCMCISSDKEIVFLVSNKLFIYSDNKQLCIFCVFPFKEEINKSCTCMAGNSCLRLLQLWLPSELTCIKRNLVPNVLQPKITSSDQSFLLPSRELAVTH